MNVVVTDFESSQEGRILSMCLIPVRVDGAKFIVRKGVLVYIREILKKRKYTVEHEYTKEGPE